MVPLLKLKVDGTCLHDIVCGILGPIDGQCGVQGRVWGLILQENRVSTRLRVSSLVQRSAGEATHLEMAIHDNLAILLKDPEHLPALGKVPWSWEDLDVDGTVYPAPCRSSGCRSSSSSGHEVGQGWWRNPGEVK